MNIDKGQTIELSNDTFGSISVTLNGVGEFSIISNGPPVNVQQCSNQAELKQTITKDMGKINYSQTAFSNVKIDGDFVIGNISQSIS